MNRKVPEFRTDEEAADFLEQDLSDLDFEQFKPAAFQFDVGGAHLSVRVPQALLDAAKQRAAELGIPTRNTSAS